MLFSTDAGSIERLGSRRVLSPRNIYLQPAKQKLNFSVPLLTQINVLQVQLSLSYFE